MNNELDQQADSSVNNKDCHDVNVNTGDSNISENKGDIDSDSDIDDLFSDNDDKDDEKAEILINDDNTSKSDESSSRGRYNGKFNAASFGDKTKDKKECNIGEIDHRAARKKLEKKLDYLMKRLETSNKCLKPSKRSIKDSETSASAKKVDDFIPDPFIDIVPSLRSDDNQAKNDDCKFIGCTCKIENSDNKWHQCSRGYMTPGIVSPIDLEKKKKTIFN